MKCSQLVLNLSREHREQGWGEPTEGGRINGYTEPTGEVYNSNGKDKTICKMVLLVVVLAWTKGLMGTLLVIVGTAFATLLGIALFLRSFFKTLETFEYDHIEYEMDKYYETERR